MIYYCCGGMRSGSTYLFTLVFALIHALNDKKPISARIDSVDELNQFLSKHSSAILSGQSVVINGTMSPQIVEVLESEKSIFISSLRDTNDCLGSAKIRWGARWTDTKFAFNEVLDNLQNTIDGISRIPAHKLYLQNYSMLFFSPAESLRNISIFAGLKTSSNFDFDKLVDDVRSSNQKVSESKKLKIARYVRELYAFKIITFLLRRVISYRAYKALGRFSKIYLFPKYDKASFIGPAHISKSGGIPGESAKSLSADELKLVESRLLSISDQTRNILDKRSWKIENVKPTIH